MNGITKLSWSNIIPLKSSNLKEIHVTHCPAIAKDINKAWLQNLQNKATVSFYASFSSTVDVSGFTWVHRDDFFNMELLRSCIQLLQLSFPTSNVEEVLRGADQYNQIVDKMRVFRTQQPEIAKFVTLFLHVLIYCRFIQVVTQGSDISSPIVKNQLNIGFKTDWNV